MNQNENIYFIDNLNFESIKHKFTIHEEPSNEAKMYYSMFYGTINDSINFYYGIQTAVLKLGSSPPWGGRGLIFSRWQTRDTLNYALADDGWGQSAGYEGDFIGVRRSYEWTVGTYETEIKRDSTDLDSGGTGGFQSAYNGGGRLRSATNMSVLDSPNTTSQITYEMYMRNASGANIQINSEGGTMTIIAMEIGA